VDYAALYRLQDVVLAELANLGTGFYLGGGTALSRFYLQHRYSDDLDFFSHDAVLFTEQTRVFRQALLVRYPSMRTETDSRGFKRWLIEHGSVRLKVDLILDVPLRYGDLKLIDNVLVDSLRNILSNKLAALWGREEPRDAADLLYLSRQLAFLWPEVLAEAQSKDRFEVDDLIYRLRSLPLGELDSVPWSTPRDPEADTRDWQVLLRDLTRGRPNSLAR